MINSILFQTSAKEKLQDELNNCKSTLDETVHQKNTLETNQTDLESKITAHKEDVLRLEKERIELIAKVCIIMINIALTAIMIKY